MLQETGEMNGMCDDPTLASSTIVQLSRAIFSESKAGYRWAGGILLAFFAILALGFAILGAPPVAGGPWDTDLILDAGWRIVNGQVPHTGFHVPLGPLTYLLAAFGMKITLPSTASITYGSVFFFWLLLPIAWYLASARFSWFMTSLFVFFEGFYFITPRPPGYPIRYTSYAMIYNRHGYVLIALLSLCAFLKRRYGSSNADLVEGLLAGIILALLLYCKITYFVAGFAIAALGVMLIPRSQRWFLAFLGAFVGVCVAFWALLHISLYAYFNDIVTAGHAQSTEMRLSLLSQGFLTNALWIYLLVFCLIFCSWAQGRAASQGFAVLHLWLVTGSIIAISLFLLSGNTAQGGGAEDPMYFLAAVVLLEFFRRQNPNSILKRDSRTRWTYYVSLLLLVPALSLPILVGEMISSGYAIAWDIVKRPDFDTSRRIHSANLRDFYVPPLERNTGYWSVAKFPEKLNDGIDLLRTNLRRGDRVTTLAYTDPFSFALGIPPADDGPLWWDLDVSFNRTHYPPAQDLLGHATLVMVPRLLDRSSGCCFATPDLMLELYGGYLHLHFQEIASTDTWVLYRRVTEQ